MRRPPGALVVRPEGELDHDSVGPLREVLERAVADPPARLVLDCGGLAFCDSTGLNLLLRAQAAANRAGLPLMLAAPGPVVARMLEITGANEVLDVHPDVEQALAAPVPDARADVVPDPGTGADTGAGTGPGAEAGPPPGAGGVDDAIGAP
ncbi:STAS domain-containing protein [Kitasatospora sp. NA04385]|nr:STAS domain-containing protein [Kitasatospora sp. NA04385]